ncbi:MAG: hypothetical protein AAGF44_11650 [Pseudomonadota bacterium]
MSGTLKLSWGAVLLVLLAVFAFATPWLELTAEGVPGLPPSFLPGGDGSHPLGTDAAGRDMALRLASALGVTFLILAAAIAGQILVGLGMVLFGAALSPLGWAFGGLARGLHLLSLPFAALAFLALLAGLDLLPQELWLRIAVVTGALILAGWPRCAMAVWAKLAHVVEAPHIRAAREIAMPAPRIWLRHMLPGTEQALLSALPLVAVETAMASLALGFLGLGSTAELSCLGTIMAEFVAEPDGAPGMPFSLAALTGLFLLLGLILTGRENGATR